ncbi:MAG: hypothetical protein DCF16_08270 [Alphaproteobacteria bacterium]|nr:MAG: hypothetical protein DCF16_08270 [Alphaproteobacteria bacterium]
MPRILRVNHAGEHRAVATYSAQLAHERSPNAKPPRQLSCVLRSQHRWFTQPVSHRVQDAQGGLVRIAVEDVD